MEKSRRERGRRSAPLLPDSPPANPIRFAFSQWRLIGPHWCQMVLARPEIIQPPSQAGSPSLRRGWGSGPCRRRRSEFLTGFSKPLRGETERRLLSQARWHESGAATMVANMRISIFRRSRVIRRDWSSSISLRRFMRKHSQLQLPWQKKKTTNAYKRFLRILPKQYLSIP